MVCKARQYSDEMVCRACMLRWDTNDPDPQECNPKEEHPMPTSTKPDAKTQSKWTREDWKRNKTERPVTPDMWAKLRETIRENGKPQTDKER